MSLTVPIAEWLEQQVEKQEVAGSIPGEGIYFWLTSRCLQLGETCINEIKHDIHPE